MTGAAGSIPSASAPSAGVTGKARSPQGHEANRAEPSDLPEFDELFTQVRGEGSAKAAAAQQQGKADGETGEEATAARLEATHSKWFGGGGEEEFALGRGATSPADGEHVVSQDDAAVQDEEAAIAAEDARLQAEQATKQTGRQAGGEALDVGNTPELPLVDELPVEDASLADGKDGAEEEASGEQAANKDEAAGDANAEAAAAAAAAAQMRTADAARTQARSQQADATQRNMAARSSQNLQPDISELPLQAKLSDSEAQRLQTVAREQSGDPFSAQGREGAGRRAGSGDAASAKVRASLTALEAALSNERSGGKDAKTSGVSAEAQRAVKDAGITSVRQETHFAPSNTQPPVLQVAQRVTQEIRSGSMMTQQAQTAQPQNAPVRVLQLQLTPPELGPLTIRMSVQEDTLRLQLNTANPDTARLLQNDRETLTGLLRSVGYTVDNLHVQVTAAERGAGAQYFGQGDGFQPSGQPGARQSEGRSGRGARGGQQGDDSAPGGQDGAAPQRDSARSGGVYL